MFGAETHFGFARLNARPPLLYVFCLKKQPVECTNLEGLLLLLRRSSSGNSPFPLLSQSQQDRTSVKFSAPSFLIQRVN